MLLLQKYTQNLQPQQQGQFAQIPNLRIQMTTPPPLEPLSLLFKI